VEKNNLSPLPKKISFRLAVVGFGSIVEATDILSGLLFFTRGGLFLKLRTK
jgi:hypothetical protein